jgi:hypothetical protein
MESEFRRLLRLFEEAAIEKSRKGSKDPEVWDEIELNYTAARDELLAFLAKEGIS